MVGIGALDFVDIVVACAAVVAEVAEVFGFAAAHKKHLVCHRLYLVYMLRTDDDTQRMPQATGELAEVVEYNELGIDIEVGEGFVDDEQLGAAHERTGEREAEFVAAGELSPAFADMLHQAEPVDDVFGLAAVVCALDAALCGAVGEVLLQAAVPYGEFLRYIGYLPLDAMPPQSLAFVKFRVLECSLVMREVAREYA